MWRFLVIIIFLIWYIIYRRNKSKFSQLYSQLKSDYGCLPIVGHSYHFIGNDEVQMKTFQKFGQEALNRKDGMAAYWLGDRIFVVVVDPIVVEFILKTCMEKGDIMRFARVILGNGSIFAPVNIWRPRRKILAPTFSPRSLAAFVQIFAQQSSILAARLEHVADGKPVSIWPFITTYTMDSVCESTLGVQVKAQENPDHPFLVAFDEGSNLVAARTVRPWLHSDAVYRLLPQYRRLVKVRACLAEFVEKIIREKREEIKTRKEKGQENDSNSTTPKSFLEMLVEASGGDRGYSTVELREEILVLVLAGTDTSAVGTAFTSLILAIHQDVQEKVYQELQDVFGDSQRPMTAEDLPRLKYLDAVIRETLRLYPPVPIIVRVADTDVNLPCGMKIPKDTMMLINIWALHRNPRYWGDDADQFRPERFLETPLEHSAQFMPFSHGPRNCLGYQYAMQSMKTALATLLRRFRLRPHSTLAEPRVKYGIMMKDVNNFTVIIEKR